jgi:hypothetical protein
VSEQDVAEQAVIILLRHLESVTTGKMIQWVNAKMKNAFSVALKYSQQRPRLTLEMAQYGSPGGELVSKPAIKLTETVVRTFPIPRLDCRLLRPIRLSHRVAHQMNSKFFQ